MRVVLFVAIALGLSLLIGCAGDIPDRTTKMDDSIICEHTLAGIKCRPRNKIVMH